MSVRDLLELHSGGLGESTSAYIILCLAVALDHVHMMGYLHIDVNPTNILINSDLVPKLVSYLLFYSRVSVALLFVLILEIATN